MPQSEALGGQGQLRLDHRTGHRRTPGIGELGLVSGRPATRSKPQSPRIAALVPSGPLVRGAATPPATAHREVTGALVLGAAAVMLGVLAVVVLALVVGGGAPTSPATGLRDAGRVTGWGLPVTRLLTELGAVGTVGTLLFAAVLSPSLDGRLREGALRAARAASWWALGWAAAAAVGGVLAASSLFGVPVRALPPSAVVDFVTDVAPGRAAGFVVAVMVVVALAARRCAGRAPACVLLALALAAVVLPVLLTGHAATAQSHLLAVSSLSVHVVSATLWVGGLLALVVHGREEGASRARTASRFSLLALVCFVTAGASGLVNAGIVIVSTGTGIGGVLGSGYGALLVAKLAALVALGTFGWWHRTRTLPRLAAGRPRAFRRLAAVEVLVMLATLALAVALAASPSPSSVSAVCTTGPAVAAGPGDAGAAAPQPGGPPAPGQDRSKDPADQYPADQDPTGQDMAGHDHGELSVGVFIDETRFHVSASVSPGQPVTVYNESGDEVTITADDGSFDAVVPSRTFITFRAPEASGEYVFSSRHSRDFRDVLVVR